MTDEELQKYEQEHGEIKVVRTALGPVVVRGPNRAEYKRFRSNSLKENMRDMVLEELGRSCVVNISKETYNAWLDKKPAIAELVGHAALQLAGGNEEEEAKK